MSIGINGNKNLRAWERIDGLGNLIPCSISLRKNKPKDGFWREVTGNYCCNSQKDSILIFRNTTASANITSIISSDDVIHWTGTLANGGYLALEIPSGINQTVTVTVDTPSGRTITTATVQGSGTISAIGGITVAANNFTTSATPNSQYTIILS